MTASNSSNDPIYLLPTFDESAVPLPGLDLPRGAFAGRTRSMGQPIHPHPVPPVAAVGELEETLRQRLEAAAAQGLSKAELAILRGWMSGMTESDSAAELSWTADAVREARARLLRRLRVAFDPSST
jgi:hypothetical protein